MSAQPQPETPQQIVNSAKGWSAFTRVLSRTVPTQLYYSQTARYGIRSLIRHGR